MEISKKDIECKEIVDKIERLTSSVRRFIQLVNKSVPKDKKLNKENIIIERFDESSFLNDGNTQCAGFGYKIFWAYTPANVTTEKEDIIRLQQPSAVTFVLETRERCYDHKQDKLLFFSLYYKPDDSTNVQAERIDYINDNYNENHLFKPYEIMQVVWRVRNALGLNISKISEDPKNFEQFAADFKDVEIMKFFEQTDSQVSKDLPQEVVKRIYQFEEKANKFATIVNCYSAVSSGKVTTEDVKRFITPKEDGEWIVPGECTPAFVSAIEEFLSNSIRYSDNYEVIPKSFLIQRDSHNTLNDNERDNSFNLLNCIKSTVGYSYFNEYVFLEGIAQNWHPRLLYFSYYISEDFKDEYYTISLTSCEGRFRKDYIKVIESTTLEEILSPKNAIQIAKWLEEIWEKTALMYYYSSLISKKEIRKFQSTCDID